MDCFDMSVDVETCFANPPLDVTQMAPNLRGCMHKSPALFWKPTQTARSAMLHHILNLTLTCQWRDGEDRDPVSVSVAEAGEATPLSRAVPSALRTHLLVQPHRGSQFKPLTPTLCFGLFHCLYAHWNTPGEMVHLKKTKTDSAAQALRC